MGPGKAVFLYKPVVFRVHVSFPRYTSGDYKTVDAAHWRSLVNWNGPIGRPIAPLWMWLQKGEESV